MVKYLEKRNEYSSQKIGKKKIALINPPSFFLTDDKVFFSLGLLYIAGAALDSGHQVHLEDLAGRKDYLQRAKDLVINGEFDLYGVTATSPQYGFAVNILHSIKSVNPKSRVVLGGPHATMFASLRSRKIKEFVNNDPSLLDFSRKNDLENLIYSSDINFKSLEYFDQVIEGEELGIFHALNDLSNSNPPKWIYSGVVEELDSLPYPARELIDLNEYTFNDEGRPKFEINGGPATSVISQRGCPFGCLFCSGRNVDQYRKIKVNGKVRAHNPQRMVNEFNMLNNKYGFTRFMIYDDELNVENNRFIDLMTSLKENNDIRKSQGLEEYHFRGFVKSELFLKNPLQAKMMKLAGFSELLSGFESGSNKILDNQVKKHTSVEINYGACKLAFENGLKVKALTMIGHPSETYEDVMKTYSFLDSIGKLAIKYGQDWNFDITILTPYPGSPIYDSMKRNTGKWKEEFPKTNNEGDLYMKEVDFATEGIGAYKTAPGEESVLIRTPSLSSSDLYSLRNQIDKDLRSKYHVKTYERKDIEHSMGQSI